MQKSKKTLDVRNKEWVKVRARARWVKCNRAAKLASGCALLDLGGRRAATRSTMPALSTS